MKVIETILSVDFAESLLKKGVGYNFKVKHRHGVFCDSIVTVQQTEYKEFLGKVIIFDDPGTITYEFHSYGLEELVKLVNYKLHELQTFGYT